MTALFQSTQPEWAATYLTALNADMTDFNPRSPSGLRLTTITEQADDVVISIHAARVGCDAGIAVYQTQRRNFNPRSPSGLRRKSRQFLYV